MGPKIQLIWFSKYIKTVLIIQFLRIKINFQKIYFFMFTIFLCGRQCSFNILFSLKYTFTWDRKSFWELMWPNCEYLVKFRHFRLKEWSRILLVKVSNLAAGAGADSRRATLAYSRNQGTIVIETLMYNINFEMPYFFIAIFCKNRSYTFSCKCWHVLSR